MEIWVASVAQRYTEEELYAKHQNGLIKCGNFTNDVGCFIISYGKDVKRQTEGQASHSAESWNPQSGSRSLCFPRLHSTLPALYLRVTFLILLAADENVLH